LVFNTRSSALKAYRQLKDLLNGPVLFLSTWMIPRHRKKIMACLKYLEKRGIRHYLIATQVVEAGVDLDFNWVFRDMGPLDSIVQVAGRCNRHKNDADIGKVLVAELVNEKDKPYCSQVYDDILLDSSRNNLKLEEQVNIFEESEIAKTVDAYYSEITDKLQSAPIWENICDGKWGPDGKYPLIKDKSFLNTERVYIEYDNKLRPLLEKLANTKWTLSNLEEKKMLVTKANQYIIEVPGRYLVKWKESLINKTFQDELPPIDYSSKFKNWFVTKEGSKYLYNRITGFIPPEMDGSNDDQDSFL
jgi:CRISPR-associated endonuclease/helicase Cas3